MADTIISGAGQALGTKAAGVDLGDSAADPMGLFNAPDLPLTTATFDQFNGAFNSSENPLNFSGFLKDAPEADTGGGGGREDVVQFAKKFLGMQYTWGGSTPSTSFDCSGFTKYVLSKFGVQLPRVSYQQANYGKRTSIGSLTAGDLVAWDNSSRNNGADHIALYIGNGRIMEFYSRGKPSRIRRLGKNEGAWGVKINYPK